MIAVAKYFILHEVFFLLNQFCYTNNHKRGKNWKKFANLFETSIHIIWLSRAFQKLNKVYIGMWYQILLLDYPVPLRPGLKDNPGWIGKNGLILPLFKFLLTDARASKEFIKGLRPRSSYWSTMNVPRNGIILI